MKPYILDASAVEYERLDLMSKILDLGLRDTSPRMGSARAGSALSWVAVTAASQSGYLLRPLGERDGNRRQPGAPGVDPCTNLSVQQIDVRTGELPPNTYDLVTCRALLHQIAEYAPAVLAQMAAAAKPGGWLLIQESDFHLAPTTEPEVWASMWKGLTEWGRSNGIDWLIGRKLPSMVEALGFGHPQAKADVQNIRGRDRGALYFQLFFAEVRDRVVGDGQLDAATIDAASALLDDPNYWAQCWMMTAVWVRKPLG